MSNLTDILQKHQPEFASVVPYNLHAPNVLVFDLSVNNSKQLQQLDISNTALLTRLMYKILKDNKAEVGVGGYMEHRMIYERSNNFDAGGDPRRLHIGIDIWAKEETPVFAPLDGKIHSFQDNKGFGDYGPTIILEHQLDGVTFYTLYGHLSLDSLPGKSEGQFIKKGEQIAKIGNFPENGDWPPHLHFQIITDMQGKKGDFIGVCSVSERPLYEKLCPDPNLILGIEKLRLN